MRTVLAAATVGVVAALVPIHSAGAYVANAGTGARTATVTAGQALTVTGTTAAFPGSAKQGDTVGVTASLTNPNPFRRWAHTVTAQFASATKGCGSGSFTITGSPRTVNAAVPPGTNKLQVSGLTVVLANGNCKGATVTLAYTVS